MQQTFGKLLTVLTALCAVLASCASSEIREFKEYTPSRKGLKKVYNLKQIRLTIESEPSRSDARVVLKVERMKVHYYWRKINFVRYRIWDDNRPKEKVEKQRQRSKIETFIVRKPFWEPWPGLSLKLETSESSTPVEITTGEDGRVEMDVRKYAHCWIEGRPLTISYFARTPTYEAMTDDFWTAKVKKRMPMPAFAKVLGKYSVVDVEGSVSVPRRTLERIFDAK